MLDAAQIRQKPGAINLITHAEDWSAVLRCVAEFSVNLAPLGMYEPISPGLVVVNDADYYLSDGTCGSFTTSCHEEFASRVETIGTVVANRGGNLVVTAALDRKNTHWLPFVAEKGWRCETEVGSIQFSTRAGRPSWMPSWSHPMAEEPPKAYQFGPLAGQKKTVASWLHPDGKPDSRRLKRMAKSEAIWVRQEQRYHCEVWFRSRERYLAANSRKLESKSKATTTAQGKM